MIKGLFTVIAGGKISVLNGANMIISYKMPYAHDTAFSILNSERNETESQ